MIAQELEVSLHMAFVEARQKRHEFITVEHLLLAARQSFRSGGSARMCSEHRGTSSSELTIHRRPHAEGRGAKRK